jgi:PAS domain S-box-containing protein
VRVFLRWSSHFDGRRMTRLVGLAVFVYLAGASFASAQARRVVVLYDERTELPGMTDLDSNLVQTLTRGFQAPLEVFREAMDLSRFGSPEYILALRDHLLAKYAGKRIDVAIAVNGPALDFLLAHGGVVFPGTPVVFLGVDRRELGSRSLPPHVTGILFRRAFLPTAELALRLHPGVRRIVMVGGTGDFDSRLIEQARRELRVLENRVAITYLTSQPLDTMLAALGKLPPRTVVLYATLLRDGVGQAFHPHEVAARVAAAANAPVYVFLDRYIGLGVVGGQVYSLKAQGEAAAERALQILAGKPPSAIPVDEVATTVPMFDWRQLQRWGISGRNLPPASVVRFESPTVWQRYRRFIVPVAIILVLQTLLITALLIQGIRRRRAEAALRQSEERYREVVETQTELICRFARDARLTFVNPAYARYFGRSPEELIGSSFLELVPEFERATVRGNIEALATTKRPVMAEHRVVAADGSIRWQQWVNYAILAADGSVTEFQAIGREITERKEMEESLRRSEGALRMGYEHIQQLAGRLIHAQEEERARIARDLHDDVCQRVASFSIALSVMKREVPHGSEATRRSLSQLQQQAIELTEDLRKLSHDLHPSTLAHVGFLKALQGRCSEFTKETGIPVRLEVPDALPNVSDDVGLCLYRVAQEALHNVATHAHAHHVIVSLIQRNEHFIMRVGDDGRGFDPKLSTTRSGLGLVSLRERVHLLGGMLEVKASPGAGTLLMVSLPAHARDVHEPEVA